MESGAIDSLLTRLSVTPTLRWSGQFVPTAFQPRHIVSVPTRIPEQIYNSFLAESTIKFRNNWMWGRAESADKDSTLLFPEAPFVLLINEVRLARVQAYTAGYERELPRVYGWLSTGLGSQVTMYHAPPALAPIYGANPIGVQLFWRLRLARTRF